MKQRGRKSQASLSIVGTEPRLVSTSSPDDLPPPPAHLGEHERQIWRDVLSEYKGTRSSTAGLEAYQRAREARETIDAEGLVVTGRDGQTKTHPLCSVERDARAAFAKTFKQLGIKT